MRDLAIILLAVTGAALLVPWGLIWSKLTKFNFKPLSPGAWDSDEPPCKETQLWADAIDTYCQSATDGEKWSFLRDKLSPIKAASKTQDLREADDA